MDQSARMSVVRLLDLAMDAQARAETPEPTDLYTWGAALSAITDRLDAAASIVAGAVGQLERETELRDDQGANPWQRLHEAQAQLDELRSSLIAANNASRRFHSSIGHVGRALGSA